MDKFKLIEKHAKKFVYVKESTPILQGICYRTDGSVVATDRSCVLIVKKVHELRDTIVIHAKTGIPIQGEYPDVNKFIPVKFENLVQINNLSTAILQARCAMDVAKQINKYDPIVNLLLDPIEGDSVRLRIDNEDIFVSAEIGNAEEARAINIKLNAEYLYNALKVFEDAKAEQVDIKIGGDLSPISMTCEDVEVLILPYRVSSNA